MECSGACQSVEGSLYTQKCRRFGWRKLDGFSSVRKWRERYGTMAWACGAFKFQNLQNANIEVSTLYDIYPSNDNRWTSTTTNSTFCLTYLSSRAPQHPPVTTSTTSASLLSVSVSNNNWSIRATRTTGLAISKANVQDPPRHRRNYQPKKAV